MVAALAQLHAQVRVLAVGGRQLVIEPAERDDGSFLDIVFWQSHEAALAASAKMMEEMAQDEAMTMIDPMGLEMNHATIRLTVD